MSKPAAADVIVARARLKIPIERYKIRVQLYESLSALGRVDHVTGYVVDPPDGPYKDSFHDDINRDDFATVRITGLVTPLSPKEA